jgi:hypothetical protein
MFMAVFVFSAIKTQNNDYLITTSGDTILGKIKFQVSTFRKNGINIQTDNSREYFEYEQIRSFMHRGNFYRIISRNKKDGTNAYFALCMVIDGKQKLGGIECDLSDSNYMVHNRFYIALTVKNLQQKIWPEMMQCSEFASLHQFVTKKYLSKLVRREQWQKLILIIQKYNQLC